MRTILMLLAAATVFPSVALAGPVEQFVEVMLHDDAPDRVVVRYENAGGGLLVSEDGGHTFALLCTAGTGVDRTTKGVMAADGTVWLASFETLTRDDRHACNWVQERSLAGRWASDLIAAPTDPPSLFAVTSDAAPAKNGIYRGDGHGFSPFGSADDAFITRIRAIKLADGRLRLYQSAVRISTAVQPSTARYVVRYSDDGAEHWIEHPLPMSERGARLEAVDPTRPDRIVVSVTGDTRGSSLWVSEDAGATFRQYLELPAFGGIAFAPDGQVFIGAASDPSDSSRRGGLYRAANLGVAPKRLRDDYSVQCLGYRAQDDTLFVCDRFVFGVADPDTGVFEPRVRMNQVEAFVECAEQDVRATCADSMLGGWCDITHFPCSPVCDAYQVDLAEFASAAAGDDELSQCLERRRVGQDILPATSEPTPPDAGTAGPENPPDPQRNGSGCVVARDAPSGNSAMNVVFAGLVWLLARRRRRTRLS